LAEMSKRLHRFLPPGIYTCAAVAVIEPGSPWMRIANAGLPYPYLLEAENRRLDQLPVAGIPLGLFGEAIPDGYDERAIELHPGDVLLFASDGLGELRDSSNNFFQDGPLQQTLQALHGKNGADVIENLVARADEFRRGESYHDDVVIVAVTKT
jgi:serine phosphatase RsbU (regulator of sigma subunit)